VAAAFAHRDLLNYRFRTTLAVPLSADVENWFFEPSDTSPGLVIALVLWLLWRRRRRLARAVGSPGAPALTAAFFGVGLATFFWAMRTGAAEIQALSAFFNTLGMAHAFGGGAALRIAAVPAVFLVFALPVPAPLLNEVVWKFQIWTAEYSGFLLQLLGQSAFVSGDQILQSDKVFQIIESCSGLRTIETLTMLTVLMVDLFRRRGLHAVLLLAAAPPVAFIMNGFRALTLIFNPHSDIASVHNLQGIVMLLAGVLLLYALDGGLDRMLTSRAPKPASRAAGGVPRFAPALTFGVLAALVALSFLPAWALDRPPKPHLVDLLPRQLDGYDSRDLETDRIFLGQAGFSQLLHREYQREGWKIDVFVARAGLRLRGRSFHSPKTAVPGSGWIVEGSEVREIQGRSVLIRVVRRGTRRLMIYHWREGSSGWLEETLRTVLALDASPWAREGSPVVVRLMAPVAARPSSRRATESRLAAFLAQIAPHTGGMVLPEGAVMVGKEFSQKRCRRKLSSSFPPSPELPKIL
jgi:exosortase